MNYDILKNQARDKLVDALIIGSHVVRWAAHQLKTTHPAYPDDNFRPLCPANIIYFPDDPGDNMDRRVA